MTVFVTEKGRYEPDRPPPLDAPANQVMEHVARIMLRCGYAKPALRDAFDRALLACPASVKPLQPSKIREIPEAAHIVTLWTSLHGYIDEHGAPVPLPLRGSGKSIQGLARRIRPTLDLEKLVRYLLHTRTVRRVRSRYVLNRRWIMLRGVSGSAHSRSIRALLGYLRTHEHNLLAESDARSWFEFTVDNPSFPVSKLNELDQHARRMGLGEFRELDLFMRYCEANRDPKEPTVWVGFGMHRFQHEITAMSMSLSPRPPRTRRRGISRRER